MHTDGGPSKRSHWVAFKMGSGEQTVYLTKKGEKRTLDREMECGGEVV